MKLLFKNILVCLVVVSIAACNRTPEGEVSWQPNSLDLTPPPGSPEYQQGWSDGCESGSQAYSSNVYKVFKAFRFKFDPLLRSNKEYYQVWKDAFLYCSMYWERTQGENI